MFQDGLRRRLAVVRVDVDQAVPPGGVAIAAAVRLREEDEHDPRQHQQRGPSRRLVPLLPSRHEILLPERHGDNAIQQRTLTLPPLSHAPLARANRHHFCMGQSRLRLGGQLGVCNLPDQYVHEAFAKGRADRGPEVRGEVHLRRRPYELVAPLDFHDAELAGVRRGEGAGAGEEPAPEVEHGVGREFPRPVEVEDLDRDVDEGPRVELDGAARAALGRQEDEPLARAQRVLDDDRRPGALCGEHQLLRGQRVLGVERRLEVVAVVGVVDF
mmetsp:Transcript_23559/g.79548  ORF Transcript_23559/g.79548 Transcript_23559/m.79548 type:complete len:271 (+) Transcript_23559:2322-3134(+)